LPASQNPSDGFFADGISSNGGQFYAQAIADNFSLSQASTITTIRFWGSSENFVFPDLTNFSDWDVVIMDSSLNVVSSSLVPKANFTITATGLSNSLAGQEFKMELGTNIALGAGNYVFHVGSINVSPGDDAWAWSEALSGDGDGSQFINNFDGNGWIGLGGDSAFELEGQPVPEPASMIALGLGAAAVLARKRKKA
jgi:hypothetical protein